MTESVTLLGVVRGRLRQYDATRDGLLAQQTRELLSALNRGAADGYGEKTVEKATRVASMGWVARNIAPLPVYLLCRGIVALSRALHEIIVAILLVAYLYAWGKGVFRWD